MGLSPEESPYFEQEATERVVPLLILWVAGIFAAKRGAVHSADRKTMNKCVRLQTRRAVVGNSWKESLCELVQSQIWPDNQSHYVDGTDFQNHIPLKFCTSFGGKKNCPCRQRTSWTPAWNWTSSHCFHTGSMKPGWGPGSLWVSGATGVRYWRSTLEKVSKMWEANSNKFKKLLFHPWKCAQKKTKENVRRFTRLVFTSCFCRNVSQVVAWVSAVLHPLRGLRQRGS